MKGLLPGFDTLFFSTSANCNCKGRGLADQRTPLLRPVHVWGYPDEDPLLPGWSHLARAPAQQRGDARGWVCGIPSPLERNAVRLLHPRGNTRVHCGVRAASCPRWATELGLCCRGSGAGTEAFVCLSARAWCKTREKCCHHRQGSSAPNTDTIVSAVKITLYFKCCQCIMNDPVTNRP